MCIEINVTKMVKYVCMAGVAIVAIIFGERAYTRYVCVQERQEEQ